MIVQRTLKKGFSSIRNSANMEDVSFGLNHCVCKCRHCPTTFINNNTKEAEKLRLIFHHLLRSVSLLRSALCVPSLSIICVVRIDFCRIMRCPTRSRSRCSLHLHFGEPSPATLRPHPLFLFKAFSVRLWKL